MSIVPPELCKQHTALNSFVKPLEHQALCSVSLSTCAREHPAERGERWAAQYERGITGWPVPEPPNRSHGSLAQKGFELRQGHLDRIEVGRVLPTQLCQK